MESRGGGGLCGASGGLLDQTENLRYLRVEYLTVWKGI